MTTKLPGVLTPFSDPFIGATKSKPNPTAKAKFMQLYVVSTFNPVTDDQADVLRRLGLDVDTSASRVDFMGEITSRDALFLRYQGWIAAVEPVIRLSGSWGVAL